MNAQDDRTFLARDAYRAWKGRVKDAAESVVVFTPYLDDMLDRLLKNAALKVEAITVVTDLSPASGALDYRAQLIGVRALMRRGVNVRSLRRLHAKVLLCDWRIATVGSQNFTSYGRRSHETTAVPPEDLGESRFVATLREWFDAAIPVDIMLVERLLEDLEAEIKAVRDAQRALAASYEKFWEEYQRELELKRQRQLEEEDRRRAQAARPAIGIRLGAAVRSAQERMARPVVWARLSEVGHKWDSYNTLLTDRTSNLTRWPTRSLIRLNMYPVILDPTGRMGLGRVAVTRISYVRSVVNRTTPWTLAGMKYQMRVEFPNEDLETANILITLRPTSAQSSVAVRLSVRFDGVEAILAGHEIAGDGTFGDYDPKLGWRTLSPGKVAATFADPDTLNQLMQAAFQTFKYSELGKWDRDADQFFPPGLLRVTLIEYAARPILAVSE